MKKIQLMFAAQQLSKEQMKNVSGGGDPSCNIGNACELLDDNGYPLRISYCVSGPSGCGCYAGDSGIQYAAICFNS